MSEYEEPPAWERKPWPGDYKNLMTDPAPLRADHVHNAWRDTCGYETPTTQLSEKLWPKYSARVTELKPCGRRKVLDARGFYVCPVHDAPDLERVLIIEATP